MHASGGGRRGCARPVADTIAAIVAKTDGVPLFVEELTRSVMESAGEGSAVPATLKDSLMARLDRLGGAREVAQIAAVIGRQFTFALLEAVSGKDTDELEAMLAKLVAAGIVFPEERGLERSFNFKHALVRDAAYESLLLTRRREWHGRVAQALEQRFADIAASEPELLAYHFGEAGLLALGLRLPHARRQPGREPLGLCGSDRAFHGGSQARRSYAASRTACAGNWSSGSSSARRRSSRMACRASRPKQPTPRPARSASSSATARFLPGQMGPLDQRQSEAQDRLGARPRRRTGDRSRNNPATRVVARSLSLPVFDGVFSRRCPRTRWRAAGTPSRSTIWRGTAISRTPLVATIPAFAPMSSAAMPGSVGRRTRGIAHFTQAIALAETLDHPNSLAHGLHNFGIGHQLGGDREATFAAAQRAAGWRKIRPAAMACEQPC